MKLTRRTVLRGAGVTMALPWLESLSAFAATPSNAFPKRFAVLFMGTGISPGRWWAKGSGAEMELSESLAPLEPLKKKINVIDGLFNKFATGEIPPYSRQDVDGEQHGASDPGRADVPETGQSRVARPRQ